MTRKVRPSHEMAFALQIVGFAYDRTVEVSVQFDAMLLFKSVSSIE